MKLVLDCEGVGVVEVEFVPKNVEKGVLDCVLTRMLVIVVLSVRFGLICEDVELSDRPYEAESDVEIVE